MPHNNDTTLQLNEYNTGLDIPPHPHITEEPTSAAGQTNPTGQHEKQEGQMASVTVMGEQFKADHMEDINFGKRETIDRSHCQE